MAEIKEFGGLDNQNAETDYGLKGLSVALNVDITRAGKIVRRMGRGRILSAGIEAAWAGRDSALYQSGSTLYHMTALAAGDAIAAGLNLTHWLTAEEVNHQTYWSNGVDRGVIENGISRALGIDTPTLPIFADVTGHMPAGGYMYTVTMVRADGFESGAPGAGACQIANGGIRVPVTLPDSAERARLYLTNKNGTQLYLAAERVGSGVLEYRGDTLDLVVPLRTQFCSSPGPFDHAAYYRGALYYAKGNLLVASQPYNYELVDMREDYLQFPDSIEMLAAVESGLFVATRSGTFFLRGLDITSFSLNDVFEYGAIRGTCRKGSASHINPNRSGDILMWGSERGIVVGNADGSASNLTDGTFHLPQSAIGCGAFIDSDGRQRFVVCVAGNSQYNQRRTTMLANISHSKPDLSVSI